MVRSTEDRLYERIQASTQAFRHNMWLLQQQLQKFHPVATATKSHARTTGRAFASASDYHGATVTAISLTRNGDMCE
jgi:hypothetical protein